jgi:LPXTG-site transpeptidase (sortase) family protein
MRISLPTMHYQFTESEIRLMLQEAPRVSPHKRSALVMGSLLVGFFALYTGYTLVTAPKSVATPAVIQPISPSAIATPIPSATAVATPTPLPVTLPNNTLAINALGVSAPITWNVPLEDKPMNEALNNGIIHIDGTPQPGQKGMAAFAGHSSNWPWVKNDYKEIFAPILDAKIGQIVEVNNNGIMYRYIIDKIYTVKPDDVTVLNITGKNGIMLITCTPKNTSLMRQVVEATQTAPDPLNNTPFTPAVFSGQLPSDR